MQLSELSPEYKVNPGNKAVIFYFSCAIAYLLWAVGFSISSSIFGKRPILANDSLVLTTQPE
jgi:hypothetical protein